MKSPEREKEELGAEMQRILFLCWKLRKRRGLLIILERGQSRLLGLFVALGGKGGHLAIKLRYEMLDQC